MVSPTAMLKRFCAETRRALETAWKDERSRLVGIAFATLFAVAFIAIPVFTTPGNDLQFYFQIAPWWTYAFLAVFSLGLGAMAGMQHFLLSGRRLSAGGTGGGLAALFAGVGSGVYATAACAACVSTLFSFFGAGTALFLVNYRAPLLAASTLVLAISVYFNARKVNGHCQECGIKMPAGHRLGEGALAE